MKKIISLFIVASLSFAATAQDKNKKPAGVQTAITPASPRIIVSDKVAFEAVISRPQSSPHTPMRFDEVKYNYGDDFSLPQNTFTVPTSGLYFLSLNTSWNGFGCTYGVGGGVSLTILKNERESVRGTTVPATHHTVSGFDASLAFSTRLSAGDRLTIMVTPFLCTAGSGSLPILQQANFSGYRVFAD